MKNLALTASLLAAISLGAACTTTVEPVDDATLTVVNESDYVIESIYLTSIGGRSWGGNILGDDVLFPGQELVLGVDCGYYDARLVDEDDVECIVQNINLCLNDATWYIYNDTCEVFELAAKARAAAAEAEAKATPAPAAQL
jgi:hypothetical protein